MTTTTVANDTENEGFLQLEARCQCGRRLPVRLHVDFVAWLRKATRSLGQEFEGDALRTKCRDCRNDTKISSAELYLNGVLGE